MIQIRGWIGQLTETIDLPADFPEQALNEVTRQITQDTQ
jgi:hypothetical protein